MERSAEKDGKKDGEERSVACANRVLKGENRLIKAECAGKQIRNSQRRCLEGIRARDAAADSRRLQMLSDSSSYIWIFLMEDLKSCLLLLGRILGILSTIDQLPCES
uniref:BZIP domain-containing protein n=1 Tax=Syphacia muris TaxID=451379 RepID=A0A0N5AKK2_9BILA